MTGVVFILALWLVCVFTVQSYAMEISGHSNLVQGEINRGEWSQHTWDGRQPLDAAISLTTPVLEKYKMHNLNFIELKNEYILDDTLQTGERECQKSRNLQHFEPNEGNHDLPLPLNELQFPVSPILCSVVGVG